ncbi:unnamed protein product [Amaranthus hypochondriacus]
MSNSRRSSLVDHQQHHRHHYNYPSSSFSSSLLEEIYRSFDENEVDTTTNNNHRKSLKMMNKSNSCYMERETKIEDHDRFRVNRYVLDQWIEGNNNNEKIIKLRRNSMAAMNNSTVKFNSSSSSSSSDSSSGIGGFSSSDTDSFYGSSKSKSKSFTLKPIKTSVNHQELFQRNNINNNNYSDEIPAKKNKEGNLQKRALKLYGDLKKVKQPISPGGKLASFLNSLFNSNASKKPKISSSISSSNGQKFCTSTPSTASSYSRSCLSKTPSSAGRFERRSVRFCPVNTVISADKEYKIDQDYKQELKVEIMEKHRRVEEVAKELLKNYHGRKYQSDVNNNLRRFEVEDEEEEDDDVSCCSSDLFELEIGGDRRYYHEELPVYETTHVNTNRAIANGFIL